MSFDKQWVKLISTRLSPNFEPVCENPKIVGPHIMQTCHLNVSDKNLLNFANVMEL